MVLCAGVRDGHGGVDTFERDHFAQNFAVVTLVGGPFGDLPVQILFRGPFEIPVFFDGTVEGALAGTTTPQDPGTPESVSTGVFSMQLQGEGAPFGPGHHQAVAGGL